MQQRQRREQAKQLEQQLDRQKRKLISDEARRVKAAIDLLGVVKESAGTGVGGGADSGRMEGPITRERERNRACSPAYLS